MPDPFEDDDEGGEVDLGGDGPSEVEALADKLEQDAVDKDAPAWQNAPRDETVDVPITPSPEEDRRTRKEKRAGRYKDMQDSVTASDEREKRANERSDRLEAQMAQMQAQMHMTLQSQGKPPAGPTSRQKEMDDVYNQRKDLSSHFGARQRDQANPPSKEEIDRFMENSRRLEDKYIDLRAEQRAEEKVKAAKPEPIDPRRQAIEGKHYDVLADPRARLYMQGRHAQLQAEGRQDGMELVDEVMEESRKKFGLGHYKAYPNDRRTKAMYSGTSAGSGGGGGKSEMPTKVPMTSGMKSLADQAYSHLPEGERYTKWARENGEEYLEMERLAGR